MNWGHKILLVFSLFVAGMLFLVVKSTRLNQDLVMPDYYEEELKFQDKIDEVKRANALSGPVTYTILPTKILVKLPQEMATTTVSAETWLYCITDKNKDIKQKLVTNDGSLAIALNTNSKGWHQLKISWDANGQRYYYEKKLLIP